MGFHWEQKYNHETHWGRVESFDSLSAACHAVRGFKTHGITVSGRIGQNILQQRIIDDNGHIYSKYADGNFD